MTSHSPRPPPIASTSAPLPTTAITSITEAPATTERTDTRTSEAAAAADLALSEKNKPTPTKAQLSNHPLFATRARGLRTRIMRFTPSWFSVTMGTGIVNTLLFDLPWAATHPAFRAIGAGFLIFDIILFVSFTLISILRYSLYPAFFVVMIRHETHSLFLGTIPMGLVTIVSGIARTGGQYGIGWTLDLAMVLWWISLVMSVMTSFGVPFIMFTRHKHTTEALTAAWLLPIVPPITVGATGAGLCTLLVAQDRLSYALTILVTSYIMTGVGLLIACGIMVIYFQRLAVHHLPGREVITSTFLPVGPCGQGGFALLELGRVAVSLFPKLIAANPDRAGYAELAIAGPALYGSGLMTGMLLWGLGAWWTFLAIVSVGTHYIGKTVAFNMGWWAFTFPLGSLTLLTFSLGVVFDSLFFNVVGAIMTFLVVALWTLVFVPTVLGFFGGTLFPAPCLNALPPAYVEKLPMKQAATEGAGNGETS